MNALKSLVISSRPLSWVNTAFPFAAAYWMSTRHLDAALIVGTLYFLIPYNVAMYGINDVFDYESDLRNPRKGGVEGALLDPSVHRFTLWAAVVLNVPFLVYFFIVGSPLSLIILLISIFAVLAYSAPQLRFKERPFIDSLTSATHFVSPAVFGLVLAGAIFTPALWFVLAAFFIWGLASHAFGAVQDIIADREAGIGSIATVIGSRRTVRLAFVAYLVAAILLLFTRYPGPYAAILMVPYALNVVPYLRIVDAGAETANAGWRRFLWLNFITGFLVTMLLIWYSALTYFCGTANFGWFASVPSAVAIFMPGAQYCN